VVDDDLAARAMISAVLRQAGHEVQQAENGVDAQQVATADRPELIITDLQMPVMDGFSLVKKLRAHKDTAFVPILCLSETDDYEERVRGFRLGADDFIVKPFSTRDLVARVERMLEPMPIFDEISGVFERQTDLEGRLERIGMSAVLIMLEAERKTGQLTVRSSGRVGRVWMRKGHATNAEITGNADVEPKQAIYGMLGWSRGSFEFIQCAVPGDDRISTDVTYLLIEGARRIDEDE
jgi:CheY-like chemotaxis protein